MQINRKFKIKKLVMKNILYFLMVVLSCISNWSIAGEIDSKCDKTVCQLKVFDLNDIKTVNWYIGAQIFTTDSPKFKYQLTSTNIENLFVQAVYTTISGKKESTNKIQLKGSIGTKGQSNILYNDLHGTYISSWYEFKYIDNNSYDLITDHIIKSPDNTEKINVWVQKYGVPTKELVITNNRKEAAFAYIETTNRNFDGQLFSFEGRVVTNIDNRTISKTELKVNGFDTKLSSDNTFNSSTKQSNTSIEVTIITKSGKKFRIEKTLHNPFYQEVECEFTLSDGLLFSDCMNSESKIVDMYFKQDNFLIVKFGEVEILEGINQEMMFTVEFGDSSKKDYSIMIDKFGGLNVQEK